MMTTHTRVLQKSSHGLPLVVGSWLSLTRCPTCAAMANGGTVSSPCGHRSLASILRCVPNILRSVVAFAGIVFVSTTPTAISTWAVGVNQGVLVTG